MKIFVSYFVFSNICNFNIFQIHPSNLSILFEFRPKSFGLCKLPGPGSKASQGTWREHYEFEHLLCLQHLEFPNPSLISKTDQKLLLSLLPPATDRSSASSLFVACLRYDRILVLSCVFRFEVCFSQYRLRADALVVCLLRKLSDWNFEFSLSLVLSSF